MKKLLFTLGLAITGAMTLSSCSLSGNSGNSTDGTNMWYILIVYAIIFGGIYLLWIRPSSKKKKEEQTMRDNIEIGDEVTTIGGIMGKVVNIKEETDSFILETGSDRTKLQFKKFAVSSIDTRNGQPLLTESERKKAEKAKQHEEAAEKAKKAASKK